MIYTVNMYPRGTVYCSDVVLSELRSSVQLGFVTMFHQISEDKFI